MKFPIPDAALDDRLAILGTAGSGKTYLALTAIERLLARGARVILIDPLGVGWGLRLDLEGKKASPFNIPIFGGSHGDIGLTEHAGPIIGETVAKMRESCIIDLSGLATKASERRFMLAFLTALYRNATKDPVHLIVDESDMFAPQRLMDREGDAAKLLGMMETIVRRGRVSGFIPWLITQRPAVLSKDVLSQADGLVALKLTSSQDRDAIGAWIEGQADKADAKAILASLPGMERGQGVVWIPGRGILETSSFPAKKTFDSSRTPKRGEKRQATELQPLDLGALKDRLAKVETDAKANDPRALKAEVARLRAALVKVSPQPSKPGEKINTVDQRANDRIVAAARDGGLTDGWQQGHEAGFYDGVSATMKAIPTMSGPAYARRSTPKALSKGPSSPSIAAPAPSKPSVAIPPRANGHAGLRPSADGDTSLPTPQRRILNALATWAAMGHHAPNNAMVAWLAGYSPSSTGYTNPRGALRSIGLADYPQLDRISLTPDGTARAEAQPISGTLLEHVLAQLPSPEARILSAAAKHFPDGATNDDIATGAGYSAASTGYTNPRGALRTKELVTYPAAGQVRAADWLFQ